MIAFLLLLIKNVAEPTYCWCGKDDSTLYILAFLLPCCMFFFVLYIRRSITKYIHYQRMREIQYTLQIYDQTKEIIKFRQKYYATKGYYQANQCCPNKAK